MSKHLDSEGSQIKRGGHEVSASLKHKFSWVLNAVCVATILGLAFEMVEGARLRNRASKRHLAEVMAQLAPGMPQERVQAAVAAVGDPRLKLRRLSSDQWSVGMPLEFGATDWILWVDLREGRVVRLRMRSSDGIHRQPEGTPADKP